MLVLLYRYSEVVMEFGEWLKAKRTGKCISFRGLAELSGVSKTHIYEIETGNAKPTLEIAGTLANALGYKLSAALKKCGK